ncbi:MAG: hypothetical protein ACYC1E_09235 [Propionibacteriaceae bacterium]
MIATVGSLLDGAHVRAWELCSQAPDSPADGMNEDLAAALLAAWPTLASATLRALEAVPLEPAWLDATAAVRQVLGEVVAASRGWQAVNVQPQGDDPAPNAGVLAVARRIGLIADLLSGEPAASTDVDRAAVVGLQANLLAPVHAVAVATMAALDDQSGLQTARQLVREVMVRTERYAVMPPVERAGRYEDVAAPAPGEPSLDGAIAEWVRATVASLTSPYRVTGTALQAAAGDAMILTATAATVCQAATQLGHVDADAAARALAALAPAHEAWRASARWPNTVYLGGVRDVEQADASRLLRQVVTDSLRRDGGWLPAEVIADRLDVPVLVATMRRGMHAVGNVALAHFQAIENLVRGRGQLWISANAITQTAYWGSATIEAACRKGWVPMPREEGAGIELLAAAREALTSTTVALAALDATATAPPTTEHGRGAALSWEQGRVVAHGAVEHSAPFETVHPSPSAGAEAERRAPIPLSRSTGMGPRR